jgi:hypothetical protein
MLGLYSDLDSLWVGSLHNIVEDLDEGLVLGTIVARGVVSLELALTVVQGGLLKHMESAFDMPVISLSILMAFSGGFFFGPSTTSSLALSSPDEKVVSSSILAVKEDSSMVQLLLNVRLSYGSFHVTHSLIPSLRKVPQSLLVVLPQGSLSWV